MRSSRTKGFKIISKILCLILFVQFFYLDLSIAFAETAVKEESIEEAVWEEEAVEETAKKEDIEEKVLNEEIEEETEKEIKLEEDVVKETKASSPTINFSISGKTNVGEIIEIAVDVSNSNNIYGASVDFIYDPSSIEIQGIDKGTLFSSDNVQIPVNSYGNGSASIAVTLTGSNTTSSNGSIAIIKAKILKEGNLKIKAISSNNSLSLSDNTFRVKLSRNVGEALQYNSTEKNISLLPKIPLGIGEIKTDLVSPQEAYTTIRISPDAVGTGELQYKFWVHDGTGWSIPQDFSNKKYYDWTPTKPGDYRLWVDVKDSTGEMLSKQINYRINEAKPLGIGEIKTDLVSPQEAYTTIRISPDAIGAGKLQYKFWIHDGVKWDIPQDFSEKNYYDWTPIKAGTYRIWVDVKDSTGNMLSKQINYTIKEPKPLGIGNINVSKPSPQLVNTTIRISPDAIGTGQLQYKFWIHDGIAWDIPQDFSSKNYYDWTPKKAGNYRLWVDVKDSTGKVLSKQINYTIDEQKLGIGEIITSLASPQPANTTIRISPQAVGAGELQYKFWIHDGTKWDIPQDFSEKNYYDWTPTKAGTYRLWVDVKDSTGAMLSKQTSYIIEENIKLSIGDIYTDKSSPQLVNTPITISPDAIGTGELQYKFWIHDGVSWSIPQDFSTKNYYKWTPVKAGNYRLWVDVKDSTGAMVSKEIYYTINEQQLGIGEIKTSKPSPQPANTTIRISPDAVGTGELQYKFWIHDGTKWDIPQDFSTKDYYDWTPKNAGTYRLWVDVKDSTGQMLSKQINYIISEKPLGIGEIKTNKPSPQPANTTIRISPDAEGTGELQYKFWIHDGTKWDIPQDFSTKDYYDWTPKNAGTYRLWVDVKDGKGNVLSKQINYTISEQPLGIGEIKTSLPSPQLTDTTIRISPDAIGTGELQYKFWIHDGAAWSIPQDFSSKNYYDWTPTKAGNYRLWVDVKDGKGNVLSKQINYTINARELEIQAINTDKASPQLSNTTIRISPKAVGPGELQYKFWIHDGVSWSVPQDFSTKNYYDWTPSNSGSYRLWVDVKEPNGNIVSKEINYTIEGQGIIEGYVNATTGVNVRSGPGTEYSIIGGLSYKNSVVILENANSSWYKIKFNGGYGYVHKDYISSYKNFDYYVDLQFQKSNDTDNGVGGWRAATKDEVRYYMDPDNFTGNDGKFMFMKLNYNSNIPESIVADIINGRGILSGKEKAFIDGARSYNVNPLYLAYHARLETGNGTSELAKGVWVTSVDGQPVEPKYVYNMYGIGALSGSPDYTLKTGSERAYKEKWFTPEAAITGGAQWISKNYINNPDYYQDTLYKMRWNLSFDSVGWHQYATDIGWAYKQAKMMAPILKPYINYLEFEVPKFN